MAACQGSSCRQGRDGCKTPQACGLLVNGPPPVKRPSFVPRDAQITVESWPPLSRLTLPREQASAPKRIAARHARNRRHFFLTLAVLGCLVIARLVLRHFFPEVFA